MIETCRIQDGSYGNGGPEWCSVHQSVASGYVRCNMAKALEAEDQHGRARAAWIADELDLEERACRQEAAHLALWAAVAALAVSTFRRKP